MGKFSKVLGTILLLSGIACIGMYFVTGNKKSEFKIVFDSNGGSAVIEQIVKPNEKATKPADPIKDNSEFLEWQLNGVTYNFDSVVTSDLTLVAMWKDNIVYNVKVTLEGVDYTADVLEGSTATLELLNIPPKEGYTVKLYNENNEEFDLNMPITANMVLTAQYVEIKTYTVTFNSNGGSKVDSVKVVEGLTVSEPITTKDGFVLDGWYDGETKYDFAMPVTKNLTLKARWNDGPKINVIFTVDGETYKTVSVKENTKVTKPSNPTKKGYKFVEWQLNGAAFDFNTPITSEITLTALFEESKSVTVTFDSNGGSKVANQEVETGGKAKEPTAPTKDGYKFVFWQLNGSKYDFNTAVNDNIKLVASWIKSHTVKFMADGKEVASQVVTDGEKATKPTDPVKDGYTFVEWLYNNGTYNFETPVTVDDMVITARFEKNTPDEVTTPSPTAEIEEDK